MSIEETVQNWSHTQRIQGSQNPRKSFINYNFFVPFSMVRDKYFFIFSFSCYHEINCSDNLFYFVVLDLVLPGIEGFLKDVLQEESLSDEGEKLRRFYVKILENSTGPTDTDITETFGINKNDLSPLKTPPIKGSRFSYNEGTSAEDQHHYPQESQTSIKVSRFNNLNILSF